MNTIKRYWHYLMCTVSRKYRLTHVQHVDELPPWTQRRMRRECEEMDPHVYSSADELFDSLDREIESERKQEREFPIRKAAAVFA